MSIEEMRRPVPDERTIYNNGRSMDDFEPDNRTLPQRYAQQRPFKLEQIDGMIEPYKSEALARAQEHVQSLFEDGRARTSIHPGPLLKMAHIWMSRRTLIIDNEQMDVTVTLIDGETPQTAEKMQIHAAGLSSFLEVDGGGGRITETIKHQHVSHPVTMHDAAFYTRIVSRL